MNIKYFKAILAGLVLSISSFTHAGMITTLYDSNNNGAGGGAVYFDLRIGNTDLSITGFDINSEIDAARDVTALFDDFQVWLLADTTSQGNETSLNWSQVATGRGYCSRNR